MAILFQCPWDNAAEWEALLRAHLGERELRVYPEVGARADIEVAVVWRPPRGALADLPNLRLVQSLGAGVDHIPLDRSIAADVPIARLVDPVMGDRMAEYVLAAILRTQRQLHRYAEQQRARIWRRQPQADPGEVRVGILGLGYLGRRTAEVLVGHGYAVAGWSRRRKRREGVTPFCGPAELPDFLRRSDYLVCLLPLTAETRDILNRDRLALLPAGGHVINCARGEHLVEDDLLELLDAGHLGGATLDVFREEPPPADHPFWSHPRVFVTPHVSSISNPPTAVAQIVENIERLETGRDLLNLMDRAGGY